MSEPDRRRPLLAATIASLLVAGAAVATSPGSPSGAPSERPPLAPAMAASAQPVADAVDDRQARLVEVEDERIFAIVSDPPRTAAPYEVAAIAPSVVPTVVLTARERPYDLAALERLGAAEQTTEGIWLIIRSVLVARGAELRIEQPGITLRLVSGQAGFASIVAFKGGLVLAGAPDAPLTVVGWDPAREAADTVREDGRAYVRSVGGRMDLTEVRATDLGFWSGRTGGVAWTGSAGEPGTGSATATVVERSHYGLFTSGVRDLTVSGGAVRGNATDGLLVHRESSGVTVTGLEASDNARHGVSISPGTERIALTGVTAARNGGTGIRIDGSPLATTASAGGASTASGRDFVVEGATVTGNGDVGILASSAAGLALRTNAVSGSADGIVVRGVADRPVLADNTVQAGEFGIAIRDGITDAQLTGNRVETAAVAVQVADASAAVRGNTVQGATRYAISLVGAVAGTQVGENRLAGRGPAAVDVNRVAVGANVAIGVNIDDAWIVDRDELTYWRGYVTDHPLLLLWLLILLLPVIAQLRARRRSRRDGDAHPYAHLPPGPPSTVTPPPVADPASARVRRAVGYPPRTANRSEPAEPTALLPVTRVTVVSGRGAST